MKLTAAPSKTDQLFEILRDEIISGRLATGSRLDSIRNLSERFSVSQPVVTGALDNLEEAGLVVREPRKGVFIKGASRKPNKQSLIGLLTPHDQYHIEGYYEPLGRISVQNRSMILPLWVNESGNWREGIDLLLAQDPAGILIDYSYWPSFDPIMEILEKKSVPICFAHKINTRRSMLVENAVFSDFEYAFVEGLKYLQANGHRRIVMLVNRASESFSEYRELIAATKKCGLEFPSFELEYIGLDFFENNLKELIRIFTDPNPPTALLGSNDYCVFYFTEKMKEYFPNSGYLEKIGFYNTVWSRQQGREFSSFEMNFETIWKKAFRHLLDPESVMEKIEYVKPAFIERKPKG
jgi:DNA-binding LacI/PurR family transcriptional regulator